MKTLNKPFQSQTFLAIAATFGLMATASAPVAAGAGTSGANLLSIPMGTRAIGMGEAFTAQADDVSSLYWNPAGLALLNQSQASFMYNEAYENMTLQNLSVATPLENGGIGASLTYQSFGQIAGYDVNDRATGNVSAYSGDATVGGGWLAGPLSLGLNLKSVRAKLDDTAADGVGVDAGMTWTCQKEILDGGTFRAAATVKNVGTGLKFQDERDPFPTEVRVGVAAVELMDKHLNLSMDYGKERDVNGGVYLGGEYWIGHLLALRAGYADDSREGNGIRAGIGVRVNDFSLDYAYAGYSDLGMSHRYEVTWRFGEIMPRLSPEERALYRRAKLAMAQGNYSEANLLFESLMRLEPKYKAFSRWSVLALKNYHPEDERYVTPALKHSQGTGPDQEEQDLLELLASTDPNNDTRQAKVPDHNVPTDLEPAAVSR